MRSSEIAPIYDPDGQLLTPGHRVLWTLPVIDRAAIMRGMGAVEQVPAGITFPTQSEYVKSTAYGINQLTSLGRTEMSEMMTPQGERAADMIGASISAVAGQDLGQLIAGAILPDNINSDIGRMLTQLIAGVVDMLLDSIGELVADVIGEALDIIPVIGALIKLVIDLIIMIVQAADTSDEDAADYSQVKIEAKKRRDEKLNPLCNSEVAFASTISPTGVDENGVGGLTTASDIFRPIYYKYRHGGLHLPLSPYSLLVMLCGPEAEGWPFSQSEYELFINEARTGVMYDHAEEGVYPRSRGTQGVISTRFHGKWAGKKTADPLIRLSDKALWPCVLQTVDGTRTGEVAPDPGLGLKPDVRARMWSLIKAIMSATQDPSPGYIRKTWGDGGQMAMGMLMDIVFRHYKPIATGLFGDSDGYWSEFLLTGMEHRLTTAYRRTASACLDDICARAGGSCTVALGDTLLQGMNIYKQGFLENWLDDNGRLVIKPRLTVGRVGLSKLKMSAKVPAARLQLTGATASRFGSMVTRSLTRTDATSNTQRALLAAAGLSSSYLLYRGAKWAHGRR